MATLKRCPNGHFYDGDRYNDCPYCEPTSQPEQTGEQDAGRSNGEDGGITRPLDQRGERAARPGGKRTGGVWIAVALLAVAAALFCLYQWQTAEKARAQAQASYEDKCDEMAELEEELEEKLEKAEEELESFGTLTDLFGYGSETYYAKTPVLVLEAGGSDGKIPIYFGKNGTVRFSRSSEDIVSRWSSEWEDNWTDVLVTPSDSAGCYTIHFTNDEDSAQFDVLVVVR